VLVAEHVVREREREREGVRVGVGAHSSRICTRGARNRVANGTPGSMALSMARADP